MLLLDQKTVTKITWKAWGPITNEPTPSSTLQRPRMSSLQPAMKQGYQNELNFHSTNEIRPWKNINPEGCGSQYKARSLCIVVFICYVCMKILWTMQQRQNNLS